MFQTRLKAGCLALALAAAAALALGGCASSAEQAPQPTEAPAKAQAVDWPKDKLTAGEGGVPTLSVYVAESGKNERMDVEGYVEGVLAGEMKNDWPLEALKAQAILARTFVLKFVEEKQSKYDGADISTDIEEAQAYGPSAVNDRVREAVSQTKGMALASEGELPYAWFHAHSGGATALAKEGLGWDEAEPSYTRVTAGNEPGMATDGQAEDGTLGDAQTQQSAASSEGAGFSPKDAAGQAEEGVSGDVERQQNDASSASAQVASARESQTADAQAQPSAASPEGAGFSPKDAEALEAAQAWDASFSFDEFTAACASVGAKVAISADTALSVAERGQSGRAVALDVGGERVNAASLRIALGSTKMRSTLLTALRVENGKVLMSGKGYGHGVGMSQWGAYAMAQAGKTAEEIVAHYFQNVEVVSLW